MNKEEPGVPTVVTLHGLFQRRFKKEDRLQMKKRLETSTSQQPKAKSSLKLPYLQDRITRTNEDTPYKMKEGWKSHLELWLSKWQANQTWSLEQNNKVNTAVGQSCLELCHLTARHGTPKNHGEWCRKGYRRYYPREQSYNTDLLRRTAELMTRKM